MNGASHARGGTDPTQGLPLVRNPTNVLAFNGQMRRCTTPHRRSGHICHSMINAQDYFCMGAILDVYFESIRAV
ncbi:hypothetical protein Q31b_15420 [Novipirellula aureliae]|uniref:Uncharacterized protein n=1 Tax=Novipirellula aureliae TaxID=2527966 RepID=A0A5C6E7R9_9BACT|nr:hypothetical protein Q31b_15420 [Novipirellula aureliae]